MSLSTNQKQIHRHRDQICGCQGAGGQMNWELGISRCKLLHVEWVNNRLPLYHTGKEPHVINHNGKEYEKDVCVCVYIYICVCITESLCCRVEVNTKLYINYTSTKLLFLKGLSLPQLTETLI